MSTHTPEQHILTIAMLAAFADGQKTDTEREAVRRVAEGLGQAGGGAALAQLYQSVLLQRVNLSDAAGALSDPAHRQLAYEMAVCVCDADGRQSKAETGFLAELRKHLGLAADDAARLEAPADALAEAAETASPSQPVPAVTPAAVADAALDARLDQSILNHALLCGALELLPQSWASMAIIPLQVKMVYAVGKTHGVELDQGHIREFIAAAGVGITSQYIEQFGRKLIGGLLGKAAGRTIGRIGGAATGMAFSFATTYALGQVAKRYYAGGRVMSTAVLQQTFQQLLEPAKRLQSQYMPQIEQTARGLDAGKVMALVRGA